MGSRPFSVGVLGATGAVGQKLVAMLAAHPWFDLTAVAASPRSVGRRYGEAVQWLEPGAIPPAAAAMTLSPAEPPLPCDLVFSALDAGAALETEAAFAAFGIPVFSNASAFRSHPRVPIVVAEVNPEHLELLTAQEFGRSFIVTNPNCSVSGLALVLKPLVEAFGVAGVDVTTMQALSGAGYPGVPALDALGNVVPFIAGEEEKIESEPGKILGRVADGAIVQHPMVVSAQANRVPVLDGHLLSVSVKLGRRAEVDEVGEVMAAFRGASIARSLPTAPPVPLLVCHDPHEPQPRRHAIAADGMVVRVGRLRRCPLLDIRFVVLVHNTVRGAAGGALLNAELAAASGLLGRDVASAGSAPLAACAW